MIWYVHDFFITSSYISLEQISLQDFFFHINNPLLLSVPPLPSRAPPPPYPLSFYSILVRNAHCGITKQCSVHFLILVSIFLNIFYKLINLFCCVYGRGGSPSSLPSHQNFSKSHNRLESEVLNSERRTNIQACRALERKPGE